MVISGKRKKEEDEEGFVANGRRKIEHGRRRVVGSGGL